MKQSLNALIANSGKIIKKTLKIATAVSKTEYALILAEQRQDFAKFLK